MADETSIQKFLKAVKRLAPGQRIIVSPAAKKKNDEGAEYWLQGKEYNEADDFDRDVEEGRPLFVRILNVGDYIGTADQVLAALKARAEAESPVSDLTK